jgi:glycogen operon protein
VRELIRLRKRIPLLRQARYIHDRMPTDSGWCDIEWLHPDGRPMLPHDWNSSRQLALVFSTHEDQKDASPVVEAVAVLFNASDRDVEFALPYDLPGDMAMQFSSAEQGSGKTGFGLWMVAARSLLLLNSDSNA